MYEFHIELENFTAEKAVYLASLAKSRCAGIVLTDTSLRKDTVLEIKKNLKKIALIYDIEVFLGFKIAYIPPAFIQEYSQEQREKEYDFIAVHGENIYDNIPLGTNLAAIHANVDILYNPGLIDKNIMELAQEKNTFFEFNTHPHYSSANALLADFIKEYNISLCWGNTITQESDFYYSSIQKKCAEIFPKAHEHDLIKKLNQDTYTFMQRMIKNSL